MTFAGTGPESETALSALICALKDNCFAPISSLEEEETSGLVSKGA
jgi:hypothetical protein